MTAKTPEIVAGSGDHVVQFYDDDRELTATVAAYLAEAISAGGTAIVIATDAHHAAFAAQLGADGIDVTEATGDGSLVSLDATATMASVMRGDRVDREAFRRAVGPVVGLAVATGGPVRVYGEIVALLWQSGKVMATIEVEELWNELARELPFSLLCAYPSSVTTGPELAPAVDRICALHSAVVARQRRDHDPCGAALIGASRNFPGQPDAPRAARRFIVDTLQEWGCRGTLLADAELIVSELATNAVVHARSPFSVGARYGERGVRLWVRDRSPARPIVRSAEHSLGSGRGLHVVAALASDWGIESAEPGKAIWAELASAPAGA